MSTYPLITIVTVCYNAETSIEKTVKSVINQTYPNIEYIIIDGCSTDKTIEIIKKYERKISYWKSEPDKGIYDAMNKGIKLATGEWVNFMNSGDTFYSNTIIEDVFSKANLSSDIIYGDTINLYNIGQHICKGRIATKQDYMPFSHQASFSRNSLLKKYGFDLHYKICADRKFFYDVYKDGYKFEYINKIIAYYEAESGISAQNIINLTQETYKIEGKDKIIIFKLQLYLFIFNLKLKAFIKEILPNRIAVLIKKHRRKIEM